MLNEVLLKKSYNIIIIKRKSSKFTFDLHRYFVNQQLLFVYSIFSIQILLFTLY